MWRGSHHRSCVGPTFRTCARSGSLSRAELPPWRRLLGIAIDKTQQVSNWSAHDLSSEQLAYAANDVRYLVPLLTELRGRAIARGVADMLEASFGYLPTRAKLDTLGVGDVFEY